MRRTTLFTKARNVYWPSEFVELTNLLKGLDDKGLQVANGIYQFNTGVMALAAAFGVVHGRKREVGANRQEISTDTFASHDLEGYIFLIPLLGSSSKGVDLLRPENEEELLREFERYAAGGFEVLRGLFSDSAGKSGEVVLQQEMLRVLNKTAGTAAPSIPALF